MSRIVAYKCQNGGCTFLKPEDDPMICKCAAESCGRRPPSSDAEFKLDTMASESDALEKGIIGIAMQRLNARVGVRELA